ncbi:hypothetical protein KY331_02710 [Candidatus Woesearchaeota archaeon]|nr:hypothetical protein [Candidatus Woesearchaeota archaeon]
MGRHIDFANRLRKQGVDLEGVIEGCEEIILDYSWSAKFGEGYDRRNFITLYTVVKEIKPKSKKGRKKKTKKVKEDYELKTRKIARVFTEEGINDPRQIKKILADAYSSLLSGLAISKKLKVRAYYLKGHPNEQELGYLQ